VGGRGPRLASYVHISQPMKTLCPIIHRGPENPDTTNQATERPLKICVVFDGDASAENAEVLIRHVASDYQRDTQLFRFDELDPSAPSVAAARSACNMDILMLAVREDRMLPTHIQLWLGLCVALRDEDQDGALVLLISKVMETSALDSPLLDYLEAIAAIGGMAFFPQTRTPRFAAGLGLSARKTTICKTLNHIN
jgi:hypothetical protein